MGVVDDVQSYLAAQGVVDGATGWPSVRRRKHDESDQLVVLTEDGGPAPEFPAPDGIGSAAIADSGVQIIVRGAPWDGDGSGGKANEVRMALHGLIDTTLGTETYIRVRSMTPEPVFMGYDDNGRPEHSIAFRMLRPEPQT